MELLIANILSLLPPPNPPFKIFVVLPYIKNLTLLEAFHRVMNIWKLV